MYMYMYDTQTDLDLYAKPESGNGVTVELTPDV